MVSLNKGLDPIVKGMGMLAERAGGDQQRNTPASLSKCVDYFNPGMRGLTASPATLSKFARHYGVSYRKVEDRSSAMGYTLDHGAYVYVLDLGGHISALLPYGSSVDDFVVMIEACLEPR